MVSNGYSKRRGPLRRPKVCKASPNPGRCHPPPPPPVGSTCSIVPNAWTMDLSDVETLVLHHCKESLPDGEDVDVVGSEESGSFNIAEGQANCQPGEGEYIPEETGVFLITMTCTFSDSSICVATATVTVEEEMP